MFDISFSELLLIAVVALLAFGPDKLPEVARSLGRWIGRARHLVATVKQDLDRELRLEELRQSMRQGETEQLHKMMEETKNSLNALVEKPAVSTTTTNNSPAVHGEPVEPSSKSATSTKSDSH